MATHTYEVEPLWKRHRKRAYLIPELLGVDGNPDDVAMAKEAACWLAAGFTEDRVTFWVTTVATGTRRMIVVRPLLDDEYKAEVTSTIEGGWWQDEEA